MSQKHTKDDNILLTADTYMGNTNGQMATGIIRAYRENLMPLLIIRNGSPIAGNYPIVIGRRVYKV
jgi:hypothetical protein